MQDFSWILAVQLERVLTSKLYMFYIEWAWLAGSTQFQYFLYSSKILLKIGWQKILGLASEDGIYSWTYCFMRCEGLKISLKMKEWFSNCGFLWTPREGNHVAHHVAQSLVVGNLNEDWVVRYRPSSFFFFFCQYMHTFTRRREGLYAIN